MDALSFLAKAGKATRLPLYALVGDETFLKSQCRDAIRRTVLGDADYEMALSSFVGDKAEMPDVLNDLNTIPFLSPVRLVEIESADEFVTKYRPKLEEYAAKPSPVGVLVLDVKSFPETTRLAKQFPDDGKIACKAPDEEKLAGWCVRFAKSQGGKILTDESAELLLAFIGNGMGLLASEIEKLAVAVGNKATIDPPDVENYVSRTKAADVFRILDFVGQNKPGEAIKFLRQLYDEGDDPLAVLGPLSYQLRKLATIDRFVGEGQSVAAAMDAAKVPKWGNVRGATQQQLNHLGRRRLGQLTEWLAEVNVGLKGGSALTEEVQLERLLVRLAKPR